MFSLIIIFIFFIDCFFIIIFVIIFDTINYFFNRFNFFLHNKNNSVICFLCLLSKLKDFQIHNFYQGFDNSTPDKNCNIKSIKKKIIIFTNLYIF